VIEDGDRSQFYDDIFNYQIGHWPMKYSGTPVCARKYIVAGMKFVCVKLKKKMEGSMEGALSISGRKP
jgi:hypothetical protein